MAKTTFDFKYKAIVKKTETGFDVVGFNTPYPAHQETQTIDDIKHAIEVENVYDISELEIGDEKEIEFNVRFVENEDSTFNQIFYK